jgi:hypothetical protein
MGLVSHSGVNVCMRGPCQVASAAAAEPPFPLWTELLGSNRLASQVCPTKNPSSRLPHPNRDFVKG